MDRIPFGIDFVCAACGRGLRPGVMDACRICARLFCTDHLVAAEGVPTCNACVDERERREADSAISDGQKARIVDLLRADVGRTIGRGYDADIARIAAEKRLFAIDPPTYESSVVDEVQQYLHDTFVDTTWPACPHHSNHPLWYSDGWWRCERIDTPVAKLGSLGHAG